MHDSVIYYHNPNQIEEHAIDKVVILLHGIGADGNSFIKFAQSLNLSCAVKFIFPNAPKNPVTVNQDDIRRSWFDILEKGQEYRKVNTEELICSANRILNIITHEIKQGITADNIMVIGFSQGGAVAYHVALSYPKLGGLIAIATYFATHDYFDKPKNTLPILICHGNHDTSVVPKFAKVAKQKLNQLGLSADIKFYETAHCICNDEIKDIKAWIEQIFI